MVSLSWDACHTSDKGKYNYHISETCGFAGDAFDLGILASEFKNMSSVDNYDAVDFSKKKSKTVLTIYSVALGENAEPIKRVLAQYAVEDGISENFLVQKNCEVNVALDRHKLIVNNITAGGASENRSAFNILSTISMGDIFTKK